MKSFLVASHPARDISEPGRRSKTAAPKPFNMEESAGLTGACINHICDTRTMPLKRTALFLKDEQLTKLQKLSEKTGAPVAELVRRAIDKYLQEKAKRTEVSGTPRCSNTETPLTTTQRSLSHG